MTSGLSASNHRSLPPPALRQLLRPLPPSRSPNKQLDPTAHARTVAVSLTTLTTAMPTPLKVYPLLQVSQAAAPLSPSLFPTLPQSAALPQIGHISPSPAGTSTTPFALDPPAALGMSALSVVTAPTPSGAVPSALAPT